MNDEALLQSQIRAFLARDDAQVKDRIWQGQSERFQRFWRDRVMASDTNLISDDDCDEIIRILDQSGKGNTKSSEVVARAMVPQGAWRRIFNELHSTRQLAKLVNTVLTTIDPTERAAAIDALYRFNEGQRNRLTGPSGNVISAFLAAYDPVANLSIISLNDRHKIIAYLGLALPFDWATASVGTRIALSNGAILSHLEAMGLTGSARTVSRFLYAPTIKPLWRGEHTVSLLGQNVNVVVPVPDEEEEEEDAIAPQPAPDEIRESMQIQALLARMGEQMGFSIWLPRADRGRVLKGWTPAPGVLLDRLPLGYDNATMATVEQIDVLWLRRRTIVRAFEVEHTTSIYSGLLRMADLIALQPNINVKLHIVASIDRREKVRREIRRPVFSFIEGRMLKDTCTFLSYDHVREIADSKHLAHLSDKVLEEYEDRVTDDDDV